MDRPPGVGGGADLNRAEALPELAIEYAQERRRNG